MLLDILASFKVGGRKNILSFQKCQKYVVIAIKSAPPFSRTLFPRTNLQTDEIISSMPSFTCKNIKTKYRTENIFPSSAISAPKKWVNILVGVTG